MIKRPILIASIGYIIGIILGLYLKKLSIVPIFICILINIVLPKLLNKNAKRYLKTVLTKKAIIIFYIFVVVGNLYIIKLNNSYDNVYSINEEIEVTGIVEAIEQKEYSNKYTIKIKTINNKKYINTKLMLYAKRTEQLNFGNYISLSAEYSRPEDSRNYKGFSYNNYLKQNGIYGTIKPVGKIKILEKEKVNCISKFVNNMRNRIITESNNNLSKDVSSVFLGILLGKKSQITDEINTYFREGNMAHILAVSGAHVSYIILTISIMFKQTGKNFSLAITTIILMFFIILTGFSPSVVRACIMAILTIISKLIHRKPDIYNNLSLSSLIILLYNPYIILNIGFQLTYLGTLGIILLSNKILIFLNEKLLNKEHEYSKLEVRNVIKIKLKNAVINLMVISISVQILIAPIIMFNFNILSYNFLLSGIVTTPVFAGIMIVGIFFLILGPFNKICFPILEILVSILIALAKFISNLPLSKFIVPTPNEFYILSYYIVFVSFLLLKNKISLRIIKNKHIINKILKTIIVILLIISIVIQAIIIFTNKDLTIHFIDVGQGDSTLIITPQNKVILIDGGGSLDENYDVGKNTLVPYLLDSGISVIDYLMVSHFDNDHVGGLKYVLKTLKVKNIIIAKQANICEEYEEFMQLAKEKNINVLIVTAGNVINIERNIKIYILYPTAKLEFADLNNNSIVAKLMYNNFSMLFTGDIEKEAESRIIEKYNQNVLKSTVLKIAHHGSKTSSTKEFLQLVNPQIALIGVGENNTFGHPNNEVLERITSMKSKVYRTDECGEITIKVNNKGKMYISSKICQ